MGLQEDLNALLAPADQLYNGPKYDPDPVSRLLSRTGQLNPIEAERLKAQQGTYLNGVDGMDENVIERVEHQEIYDAEDLDDVLGSGIFDPPGRPGTANTNTGVLASRYSLPGYVAREVPFTTSQDVTDLTDNASVVVVPGGGMAYVEAHGRLVGPASLGPQPRSPGLHPSGRTTSRFQPYAYLSPSDKVNGWDADSLLDRVEKPLPAAPPTVSRSPIQPEPARAPRLLPKTVDDFAPGPARMDVPPPNRPAFPYAPGSPSMYRPFPPAHPERHAPFAVQRVPGWPDYRRVPAYPAARTVPMRSYVRPIGARIGVGATPDESATNWAAYAVAGVVAGVALKMLHGVVSK